MDKKLQNLLEKIDGTFEKNEYAAIVQGERQEAFSCHLSQPNTWRKIL